MLNSIILLNPLISMYNCALKSSLVLPTDRDSKTSFCLAYTSLENLKNEMQDFLHDEELHYYNHIPSSKRQHSYLIGRYCAKQAIIHCEKTDHVKNILIKPGLFGHPVVYYKSPTRTQITISHSEPLGVALAFPEAIPMGVDVERITPNIVNIIESQLLDKEKKWINSQSKNKIEMLYTSFWSVKEALSKVLRTGLTTPMEIFAIKNVHFYSNYWLSEFENFTQYQAISFLLEQQICSIAYPKQFCLSLDIDSIIQWFNRFHG